MRLLNNADYARSHQFLATLSEQIAALIVEHGDELDRKSLQRLLDPYLTQRENCLDDLHEYEAKVT